MKKFTYSVLSVALATSLAACGGGSGGDKNDNKQNTSINETDNHNGSDVKQDGSDSNNSSDVKQDGSDNNNGSDVKQDGSGSNNGSDVKQDGSNSNNGSDVKDEDNGNKDDTNENHDEPATAIGRFVDSEVEGIEVFQDGKSLGITNKYGQFTYNINGGELTFKVGQLTLGSSQGQFIITPEDLTNNKEKQTVIMQVLQSLDSDNNPENGITIANTQFENLNKINTPINLIESDITPLEVVQKAIPNSNHVVSYDAARNHFAKTQQKITKEITDTLNGYWETGCISDTDKETGLTTYGMVFTKLTKVNDKDMQVQTVSHIYDDSSCTNLTSVYKEDVGIKDVTSEEDTGKFTLLSADKFKLEYNDDQLLLMHRASEDIFNNAYGKQSSNKEFTDALNGYWKTDCISDTDKETGLTTYATLFTKLTKVNAKDMQVQTVLHIYDDSSCTILQSVETEDAGIKDVTSEEDTGKFTLLSADKFKLEYNDDQLLFMHRTSEQDFNNATEKQAPSIDPFTTEQLTGYWKSNCINTDSGSIVMYLESTKVDNQRIYIQQTSYQYTAQNCSGDSRTETETETVDINNSGSELITISNNQFMIKDRDESSIEVTFNRISEAKYNEFSKMKPTNILIDQLVGYWQSNCINNSDNPTEKPFYKLYLHNMKINNLLMKTIGITHLYDSSNCTGTYQTKTAEHIIGTPDLGELTISSNDSFKVINEDIIYNRISKNKYSKAL